jgi:formate dehydrogenase major subunit
MLQYRNKAVESPGDARSETWFIYHLGRRLKARAKNDPRSRNAGLNALTWDYPTEGKIDEPAVREILKEMNGFTVSDHKQLLHMRDLKNDGSTACGTWIYCGVFPEADRNRANERKPSGPLGKGWGFAWPNDCRIIYNRASARPDGKPWSERKKLVWWDEGKQEWTGYDTPDYTREMRPDTPDNLRNGKGTDALGGAKPFTMHPDGVGWLYVPSGLKDGPLPTHYEPLESPVSNPMYQQNTNPPADKKIRPDNQYSESAGDPRFPYVLTTYRLTEHHTAGGMTRTLSHLAELQPELFTEVSPELAADIGLDNGGWATISTPRALIEARVLVTARMRPLWINGERVHQIGLPYHWGYRGRVKGDVVNDLLVISEEPNVRIMETKALVCNIIPGRRAQGSAALQQLAEQLERTV